MSFRVKLARPIWLAYFLATIAIVGATVAYGISVPFYVLGHWSNRSRRIADIVLCRGIRVLMSLQPWLNAKVDLKSLQLTRGQGRLLVSNHRSHLDAFLLLSRVEGIRIFAKRSLFAIPFLGTMMRLSRQIPVERGKIDSFWKAIETVRTRLQAGETVHVFPEMTRCPPNLRGTLDFSTAPFLTAMQERSVIVPIVFDGTDGVWPKGAFGLSFRSPIRVRALDPIDPAGFASADELKREVKRRIDAELA